MIKASSLQDLELFLRVVECGNMSEVARQLNLTNAAVSAAIKRLEANLQVTLLARTTRSLQLTVAGQKLIPYIQMALGALSDAETELRNQQFNASGLISIGMPSDLGRHKILPLLDSFQMIYPQIELRLQISDFMQDLYRDDLDIAIRYGELTDSSYIARKLCDNLRILAAAPAYIAQMPPLDRLEDLKNHTCLVFYRNDRPYDEWRFFRDQQPLTIAISGKRSANDGEVVKRWALSGQGIVYKSALDLADDIAAGRLVPLLEGKYQSQPTPIYAIYKQRKYQPYRLTALINHLVEGLNSK